MATLDELLDGLAEHGEKESTGSFTLSSSHAWKGLEQSISHPDDLPRFLVRWLHQRSRHGSSNVRIETRGSRIEFRGGAPESDTPSDSAPILDYSGRDIDLARAVVCSKKLGAAEFLLSVDDGGQRWDALFGSCRDPAWEKLQSGCKKTLLVSLELPTFTSGRTAKAWEADLLKTFTHAPFPLSWNGKSLRKQVEFQRRPFAWRRVLPREKHAYQLDFLPPHDALVHFVCSRHLRAEILMSLNDSGVAEQTVIYRGEKMRFERPGFLPGFEIIIRCDSLKVDLQGNSLIEERTLKELLLELRNEAYDMVLQLFRLTPPPPSDILVRMIKGIESVALYLLEEARYFEGFTLMHWLEQNTTAQLVGFSFQEHYSFLRLGSLLADKAGQPRTAGNLDRQAKAVIDQHGPSDSIYPIEAALIDASLEAKTRRGENDRLHHHTRSRLHLLAVRARKKGQLEQAYRLYLVLMTSFCTIDSEQLDNWFEACELTRELKKGRGLKQLAGVLKRSLSSGRLKLSSRNFQRAKSLCKDIS